MERAEVVRGQPLVNPERLIEDLTEREREVARLLAFGLGNGEIAATLFVSRNTVKTHLKHIYEKLAVRTRTEAVARCIELGLLRSAPGDDEQRAVLAVDFVDARQRPKIPAA
jgi:ATP/maltotriose-dependent transcriptional regulator MalT